MKNKGLILSLIFLIIIIFLSFFFLKNLFSLKLNNLKNPTLEEKYLVTRVVDGDTIELEDGRKVRYTGVNTPETVDPRKKVECFGQEAKEKNKALVEGKVVRLVKDISDKDKYGRLLRYVFAEDVFVNLELVKQGYAQVATYPPDVKYQKEFLRAEIEARQNNLGLWEKCR